MADYIHHDPDRDLYAVSEEELEGLVEGGRSLWKDVCIASLSLGIPTILNAIADTAQQTSFQLDLPLFLNYLFGILGIVLGIIFGFAWRQSAKRTKEKIAKIKSKPRMPNPVGTYNVGTLPDPQASNIENPIP